MKPKNRIYCRECGRQKLVFESEKKAMTFIKFNGDEILKESGRKPVRAYYCECCGGYHVTSNENINQRYDRTNHIIEVYHQNKK